MKNFFDSVATIIVASVFVIFTTTGEEIDNSFTENGLSLLGYHLCNYSVVKHVNRLVAYQKSFEKQVPCGGWIPGRLCPKTYYKEDYHEIMIPETVNLTDCCDGYEQVGLYCSLPLNRSSEFASRPGICPTMEVEALNSVPCTLDVDCPDHKKCCETSKRTVCSDPVPEDQTEKKYWYEVSVLVKMDLSELNRVDPRLLNHSRLLHSMITGALWPLKASVYHIQTTQGERHTETLASQILIGLQQLVPLGNFSSLLNDIVKRVSEVIDIVVQDALIFGVTIRILNYDFTDHLLNTSSIEYQAFSSALIKEIERSFPSNMSELYEMGKLKVQIESLKAGSVVVRLKILIEDAEFPKDLSAFDPMISNLHKSAVFNVDPQSSNVQDWDECTAKEDNDCCGYAECINTVGSYMCRCKTTMDANPARPGRNCEGEIVDPVTKLAPTAESVTTVKTVTSFVYNASEPSDVPSVLPSSGTKESSTPLADKVLPTSLHRLSIWESVKDNNTLSTSETPTLVTEPWGNVTHFPEGNITEEGLAVHEQHRSSLPGLSNATVYASLRNGSLGESSTQGLLLDESSQRDPSSVLTVTEHPELHAQNHSLDMETGTVNSSWSEKKPSEFLLTSSQVQSLSSTTDCGMPPPVERIVFSNVTSTSFHVVWTTNSALKPTFQFLLLEGKQLAQTIRTQNSNVTVSKLEPGILYTVEIKAEVCGKQSKPVQWKVKTAAQKLSGTVRITNLDYSSGFCNSSSEEYQNFTQLFLTDVRTSLTLNVRQEMDDGVIKMLITSVTNGSVIVSFDLLIAEGVDAGNVSRAFLDAFQYSNHFKVDNRTLSIHDYDECKRNETDCSPDASCNNTYGFYECKCSEGFASVNDERPGRDCEELPPSHQARSIKTKDWNSTVLPLADSVASTQIPSPAREDSSASIARMPANTTQVTEVSSEPILKVHSTPQKASPKPAPRLSIKSAVHVLCEIEKIVITIQKVFLRQESIPVRSLYLGRPHCNVSTSNSSHVVLKTGWNECGTNVQSNTTHTIVQTVLRNDKSSRGIIHHLKIISPIHCVFQNDVLTSSGYTPEGIYTTFDDLHGSGRFSTAMELFIGNSPIPKNFTISASDEIMIEVGIKKEDSRLKVVVSECWATPTNNSMDPLSFPFIHGSCPVPHTHTAIVANGDSSKAQFKLKIFSFVNDSVVYLHCRIHICVEILASTCKTLQTCKGVRSVRSGQTVPLPKTTWGPLRRSNDEEEKTPGLGTGYIVLIVVCIIVFVLGISGLIYHHRQRKAGAYDFQVKSDNFNYQAFCD
ncbi:uromodulin-like 1 [Tiliqua scincoides]|uniref:uromodulin-like 1 n=1 Tax=Tiliqua scincoides TaxID=71010 RepID=UPI0034629B10